MSLHALFHVIIPESPRPGLPVSISHRRVWRPSRIRCLMHRAVSQGFRLQPSLCYHTVSIQTWPSRSKPTDWLGLHCFCSATHTQWVNGFSFLGTARNRQMSSFMVWEGFIPLPGVYIQYSPFPSLPPGLDYSSSQSPPEPSAKHGMDLNGCGMGPLLILIVPSPVSLKQIKSDNPGDALGIAPTHSMCSINCTYVC